MNENSKKTIAWIAGGVVLAVILIYFAVGGGNVSSPVPTFNRKVEKTPQGTVVISGTSPISESGKVVTPSGEPVDQTVPPGSANAPQQSPPISEKEVPAQAVKLKVSEAGGFSPSQFSVEAGKAVTLAVISGDSNFHVFYFENPELRAVSFGVGPGETRAITFNAPSAPGEYKFRCDVPGHAFRGETGVMIVK